MKHPQKGTAVVTGDREENKLQTNAQLQIEVYITGCPLRLWSSLGGRVGKNLTVRGVVWTADCRERPSRNRPELTTVMITRPRASRDGAGQ